jgi:hypothetical protein
MEGCYAYIADILLHPLQSFNLIFQTIVETTSALYFVTGKKAVRTHAIIECDNNHIPAGGLYQARSVIVCIGEVSKSSTLNEEVYRQRAV